MIVLQLYLSSSYWPDNKKAEMYSFESGSWQTTNDYPFDDRNLADYDMLYISEAQSYLVIGGFSHRIILSQIAKFKNGKWSDAGYR